MNSPEQAKRLAAIDALAQGFRDRARRYDDEAIFPTENFAELNEADLLALTLPEKWGRRTVERGRLRRVLRAHRADGNDRCPDRAAVPGPLARPRHAGARGHRRADAQVRRPDRRGR